MTRMKDSGIEWIGEVPEEGDNEVKIYLQNAERKQFNFPRDFF
ncbi:hypothetical protein [Streptococcus sp.]